MISPPSTSTKSPRLPTGRWRPTAGADRLDRGSQQTQRWREMDSNFRYRGRRPASGRSLRAQRVETDAAKGSAHSGDCDRPFQPKVITDSGDRDHVLTRPTEAA